MTEDDNPAEKPQSSSVPQQSVFENVEVGGDISFRDLLQVLLVPGRSSQEQEHQGIRHNLPHPDYGQFVGREEELTKLFQQLRPHPHSRHSVITIDGIGGIGKSALALEAAHRFLRDYETLPSKERFEAIVWSSAKRTTLSADRGIINRLQPFQTLEDICKSIAITLSVEEQIQVKQSGYVELVCQALTQVRTLLIIDNLETVDDEAVREFLRESFPVPTKVIVTTRHRIDVAYPIRLRGMPWDDAEKLIDQECRKKNVVLSDEQKGRLYERTGGVPLAIVWTVAKIGFGYNTRNVLASLGNPKGDIAHFCFKEVVDSIKQRDSYKLLLALAACKGETVRDQLMYVAGLEQDELSCEDGLVELELLSLINKKGDSFTMLPLTKEYIDHELTEAYSFRDEAVKRLSNFKSYKLRKLLNSLSQPMQIYTQRFKDRYGTLKTISVRMDKPANLDEIYTEVQLLPPPALRYFESTESLEELYRQSGNRVFSFHNTGRKQGIEIADEYQYLNVLGGPGVGKSTFLRKVGLEALRHYASINSDADNLNPLETSEHCQVYSHNCIPVMLKLRQFTSNDLKIEDMIAQEFETCGFLEARELVEKLLRNGSLLLLLDGLDEVPPFSLNHVITEIENLVDRYDNNRFIASCRVGAYTFGGFRRFNDVTMAAFEDDQIERFIQNWFKKEWDIETQTAKRCWELLSSPDYQAAKELAQTPLLLTLLCVIYDEFQDLPKKRHALYGEALDVLLRKWASEKRIQRNPIYQELSAMLELEMLAEIAYTSFVDDQLFFPKDRLVQQIREFLVNNLNAPSHLDAETVLKEIEIQQGILVERSHGAYSFSHLAFQEYLTAQHVVDIQGTKNLVENHLTDKRWREIFLLVAGLVPGRKGADDFLLSMESESQKMLNSSNIIQLLDWINSVIDYSSDTPLLDKRLAALYLAISSGASPNYGRTLISGIANSFGKDSELFRATGRNMPSILGLVQILEDWRVFKNIDFSALREYIEEIGSRNLSGQSLSDRSAEEAIRLAFIQTFRLPLSHISLSKEEQLALNTYFETYELMVKCKEAAVRVTQKVWSEIESRFLSPS